MITKTIEDYRNTSYNSFDFSIGNKKSEFITKFRVTHPKAWNIYRYVSSKGNPFNLTFRMIYHEKCVYCGISTQVINSSNFEVDHVIPKSVLESDTEYEKKDIHGIKNLVNSCQMCNRGKLDFLCDINNLDILHPDNNKLPIIFNRKTDFSIEINPDYETNPDIKMLYDKLKLNNQLRRLDYLLMEMKDFCDEYKGAPIIDEIQKLILKIESNRRRNY